MKTIETEVLINSMKTRINLRGKNRKTCSHTVKIYIFLALLFLTGYNGKGQTYSSIKVFKNLSHGRQKPLESYNESGFISIDTLKANITIASKNDCVLIQGHSMKKLGHNKYRFHKYDHNKSDFEMELFKDSAILQTHVAFWSSGYKYTIILK
jgi:hypothetical protein